MNGNQHDSDFTACETALAGRLREWDPARREAPPSDAEQLWFRERLLAEARAGANAGSASIGGWVRLAAVVGALLLVTVSLVLVRRDRSLPVSQPLQQAAEGPTPASGVASAGSEPSPQTRSQAEVPKVGPAPVAVAEVVPEADLVPDRPAAHPDVTAEAVDAAPVVRARQLQMRGASGTRLLWTFDPDFELVEAGE